MRVGRYEFLGRVAATGSAEVYLARKYGPQGFEQVVVLKTLREGLADDEALTMFLDEARMLAGLSHPNIGRALDLEQLGERLFLVLEHANGPTLRQLLVAAAKAGTGRLPLAEALVIGYHLAEALVYLHSRVDELGEPLELVHRDLKPENVVVTYDGAVKLIDFGIARARSKVLVTRTGAIKGTPGYMAPEQARGEPVDRRADVFSLATILWEALTGGSPRSSTRLRDEVAAIDPAVDELVAQALSDDPRMRPDAIAMRDVLLAALVRRGEFPSSSDLRATARALVPGGEASKADPTRVPQVRGEQRRVRRVVYMLVAIAVVAAAGVGSYFVGTYFATR